ncbi:helix-turn-helix domain-containing protein [Streptomyces sp. NPDC001262]|uniref:helix-turn-helix domain-containing protein n=1 Tax=Streptomyces sp. NPDC001262 TaxID=3364552 RepID=UPI0036C7AFE0
MTVRTLPATKAFPETEGVRLCGRCECRLSRYNRENYCNGCLRHVHAAQRARPFVPPHVWQLLDVQHALMGRDFGDLCLLVRKHGALRQEDVAALTGLSQAFLSMLEAGVRRLTNIDKIVQLLDGLQAPMELTGPMLRTSAEDEAVHQNARSRPTRSRHSLPPTGLLTEGSLPEVG